METTDAGPTPQTLKVGRDQVTISEKQVIIDAAAEMPDWQVREFNRSIIFFQEKKYFLRQKAPAQKPYRLRYVLEPWPVEAPTGGGSFTYDVDAVAERDAAIKQGHFEDVVRSFLYLFYPFLGLLWSGTKDKLARFGIVPRTVTGISIMLTFGLIMLSGVFAKMLLMGSMKTGVVAVGGMIRAFYGRDLLELGPISIPVVWLDVVFFIFLVLDLLIRYSQHLREVDSPWGFLEWLKCLAPRKRIAPVTQPVAETPVTAAAAPPRPPEVPVTLPPALVIPGPRFGTDSSPGVNAVPEAPAAAPTPLIPGPRFEKDSVRGTDAPAAATPLIPGPRFEKESFPAADPGSKAA